MQKTFTLKLNHMLKKSLVCAAMLGAMVFALKQALVAVKKNLQLPIQLFSPIRSSMGNFHI